jgi:hypothetical protein
VEGRARQNLGNERPLHQSFFIIIVAEGRDDTFIHCQIQQLSSILDLWEPLNRPPF